MSIVIGIDCGLRGAVAFYDPVAKRLVSTMPMPVITDATLFSGVPIGSVGPLKSPKLEIDGYTLSRALLRHREDISMVVVEKVASSPQMGVVSSFRFGQGFGVVQGVIQALGLPVRYIYPGVWKPGMGLSSDKSLSTVKAVELFPEWETTFTAKKQRATADLAEAALIAYYGCRFISPLVP